VTDIMARLIGQHLSASIGQQIVIDNRPGASGILGSEVVSRAVPDGYTLLIANVSLIVNPYLYPKMPYDPLKDFMPITMVNSAPLLLVINPSIAAKSVTELIAYAKARPGQLNYGSGGLGSTPYLAAELFKSLSGIDAVHVPYKGGSPALSDLVGGQLSFMIENMPGTMPYARGGESARACDHQRAATLMERSLNKFSDLPCDSNLRIAYGNIHVVFRAGANPTGIRAISFSDLISTTETSFVCSLAT